MRTTFPVINAKKTVIGAPVINATKLYKLSSFSEAGAIGNWLFGQSDQSLTSLSGNSEMTPQSNTEIYTSNSVIISAQGEAIETTQHQESQQTIWVAFRYKSVDSVNRIIAGTLKSTSQGGIALLNTLAGGVTVGFYGADTNNISLGSSAIPANISDGDIIFAAISFKSDNGSTDVLTKISTENVMSNTLANEVHIHTEPYAIGNANFTAPSYLGLDIEVFSFGVINKFIDEAALNRLYIRESVRLAEKGVSLL